MKKFKQFIKPLFLWHYRNRYEYWRDKHHKYLFGEENQKFIIPKNSPRYHDSLSKKLEDKEHKYFEKLIKINSVWN